MNKEIKNNEYKKTLDELGYIFEQYSFMLDDEDVKNIKHCLSKLQELIDKSTQKKIIKKPVKHYVNFYCPTCNRKLSSRVKYHYCPKKDCGQALDWSDGDES